MLVALALNACQRATLSELETTFEETYEATALAQTPTHKLINTSTAVKTWLVEANQFGADIRLEAFDNDGQRYASSDWHQQVRGPEKLLLTIQPGAALTVQLSPVMLPHTASVHLLIRDISPANELDEQRLQADILISQATKSSSNWAPDYWRPRVNNLVRAQAILARLEMTEQLAWATYLEAFLQYTYLTDWDRAATLAQKAQALFESASLPGAKALALSLEAMALVEQPPGAKADVIRLRRERASGLFEQAAGLQTALSLHADLAWTINSQAIAEYYSGNHSAAELAFEKARSLALKAGATAFYRLATKNLIVINRGEGYRKSLQDLEDILSQTSSEIDPTSYGLTNIHIGERQLEHGNWQASISAYSEALDHLSLPADRLQARVGLSRAYLLSGNLHRAELQFTAISNSSGHQTEAAISMRLSVLKADIALHKENYAEAQHELSSTLATSNNPRDKAFLLLALARASFKLEDYEEAAKLSKRASTLVADDADKPMLVSSLLAEAEAMLAKDVRASIVRQILLRADAVLQNLFQPLLEARYHYLMAWLYKREGELEKSLAESKIAVTQVWKQRFVTGNTEYRTGLLESQQAIYIQHADLLYGGSNQQAQRLRFIEGIRSTTVHTPSVEQGKRVKNFQRNRISELSWLLSTGKNLTPQHRKQLKVDMENALLQYDLLQQRYSVAPNIYLDASDLRAAQQRLRPDERVFSYWLRGDNPTLWVVSRGTIESYALTDAEGIKSDALSLHELLASGAPNYKRKAEALWKSISPPPEQIKNVTRIHIVADADLHYTPWAAVAPSEITVSLQPALQSKPQNLPTEVEHAERRLYLVGDPIYQTAELSSLPGTRREIDSIIKLALPGVVHVDRGDQATRENFIENVGDYEIVHVATHALFKSDQPLLSGIAFSEVAAKENTSNYLTLHDVHGLQLNQSPLVVLSACQTAFGRNLSLEGFSGFPNAMLSAGASAVLVSLWDVPDRSTSELMAHFYESVLKSGVAPARALKDAQARVRENPRWRQPLHWSGWIIIENQKE